MASPALTAHGPSVLPRPPPGSQCWATARCRVSSVLLGVSSAPNRLWISGLVTKESSHSSFHVGERKWWGLHMNERVETPRQLAERVGLTERQIRQLVNTGQIEHVRIGARVLIPTGAFGSFIEKNKVKPCQDETTVPTFVGSKSATASTSRGANTVAAASARLARHTASKLKSLSRSSCMLEGGETAQVIPLKSS